MSKAYSSKTVWFFTLGSILAFGIAEISYIYFDDHQDYTPYMLGIPVYFLILGVSMLLALVRMEHKQLHPGRAIARLMLLNVSQFILSVIILFLYIYFIDEKDTAFLFTFGVFYIWFMCVKLFVLYNIEHHHKLEKQKKRNEENKK